MKNTRQLIILLGLFATSILTYSQEEKTTAEKLGYQKNAKLLMIHADDLGLSHSVNRACKIAFEEKGITSGSIMVPCPWFAEIAEYAKDHPDLDLGIHLTLTAEWDNFKWGGVSPSSEIASLLNENGYFYASVEEVALHAKPDEVEKEIRAQVERALAFGIKPTHLDTHMGSVMATPELFQLYIKLGREYSLPVFLPLNYFRDAPKDFLKSFGPEQIFVDEFYMLYEDTTDEQWFESYKGIIENLKPGLNAIIVHPGIDDPELQAVAINHPEYGAAWRQRDLNVMISEDFKAILKKNDIILITWKELTRSGEFFK